MKNKTVNITLLSLLLITASPLVLTEEPLPSKVMREEKIQAANESINDKNKKTVDGTTSASKLRAIRSHSAAKENETKLTVFLGLFAIAIIVFFLRVLGTKK